MKKLLLNTCYILLAIIYFVFSVGYAFATSTTTEHLVENADSIQQNNQIDDFAEATTLANNPNTNPLLDTLCQVVVFMQARTGRAIALAGLFAMGILFFLGKVTWPQIVTFGIGLALLFGAKSFALIVLPYYIQNDGNDTKTTDQAIQEVCPEIA